MFEQAIRPRHVRRPIRPVSAPRDHDPSAPLAARHFGSVLPVSKTAQAKKGACGAQCECAQCNVGRILPSPSNAAAERQADEVGAKIAADLPGSTQLSSGPIPESVQRTAEAHLGVSLEGTEIAADSSGETRARELGALAVTEGSRMSFRRSELTSGTRRGRFLLGHELTHVAQQKVHAIGPQLKSAVDVECALKARDDRDRCVRDEGAHCAYLPVIWGVVGAVAGLTAGGYLAKHPIAAGLAAAAGGGAAAWIGEEEKQACEEQARKHCNATMETKLDQCRAQSGVDEKQGEDVLRPEDLPLEDDDIEVLRPEDLPLEGDDVLRPEDLPLEG